MKLSFVLVWLAAAVFDYGTRFVWYTRLPQNQEVVEGAGQAAKVGPPIASRAVVRGSYHHSQVYDGGMVEN